MSMTFSVPKFNEMNELCVKNTTYMHKLREKQSPGQLFLDLLIFETNTPLPNFWANQTVSCFVLVLQFLLKRIEAIFQDVILAN